jgi:hypothetical protein
MQAVQPGHAPRPFCVRGNQLHVPETGKRFLDSTLESVDSAEEPAAKVAQRAGFDEDDLMEIARAVRKSMVNAVVHGNRYNAQRGAAVLGPERPAVHRAARRRRRGIRFSGNCLTRGRRKS